ncbi:metallophosphoesterase [Stigmatella sp. ncwal1]|uniref:Metallophosphoesterase n=1 Tax=Stigmatella ashevillensis TaxID=2995309 RepID=A0ABT5DMY8_9BACT|nr:metallophosphoesterase [Stigmatella ashevillena]MDC0714968.1 metallophosphoesterase [Stigmatella ashevillena]
MHLAKVPALGALAAALVMTTGVAHAATLTRSPYLQRVGPDTATVAFRVNANCTPEVRYGTGGSTNQTVRSADSGRIHAVVLNGLTPGAEYTYVVETCGASTSPKRFRTAPVPGTRRVHFAAMGDFGTGGSRQKEVAASMLSYRPELFIGMGDVAYEAGTEEQIQNNMFVPMKDLLMEVPFFAVAGNHEYVTDQAQPYLDNLYLPTSPSGGERYYSFDWGHVHFVGLDSNCAIGLASKDRCTLAAQKAWLEQDLAASKAPWKIAFFHHPPWSSGDHGSQLLMRREFSPLFEKYGVDLVLTGHDHHYERAYAMKGDAVAATGTGIPYLVVGSGGANLREFPVSKPSWSAVRNNKDYGFLDVEVTGGTLTARLVTPSGTTADTLTLTKQLAPEEKPSPNPLNLIVEGERGVAPHQAFFRAESSLTDATVSWDFGDGETSEGPELSHVFQKEGQYTVTATATSGTVQQTATAQVTVAPQGTSIPSPGIPQPPTTGPSTGVPGTSPGGDDDADAPGGGCTTVPMGALLPVGAWALVGLWRRRRSR